MHVTKQAHRFRTSSLVFSIIVRPKAVTLDEISRHGSLPTVAPVNPYTELALIYKAITLNLAAVS